jgi:hypothetical protein
VSTELQLWEQLPGEGKRQFHRFSKYLQLGPGRTLAKAAGRARAPLEWYDHAERWEWFKRATAWDAAKRDAVLALENAEREKEKQGRMTTLKAIRGRLLQKLQGLKPDEDDQEVRQGLLRVNEQLRAEEG